MSGSFESMCWIACAQTRPQFVLSSERVLGELNQELGEFSKGKIPSTRASEEVQTGDAAIRRIVKPIHYGLSYSGPIISG